MLLCVSLVLVLAVPVLSSDVLELNDDNFRPEVNALDIALVEFFAPWCGHCKRLAPEYEKAATALKAAEPPVPLIKVDCTEAGKTTCGEFGVKGYPTLKVFRNGKVAQDYDGPRDSAGIVSYMTKQAGPSSKEIKSIEEMKKFLESDYSSVVAFIKDDEDLKKEFLKTAGEMRDKFRFAHSSSEEIRKEYNFENELVLFRPPRLHNKFEPNHVAFKGTETSFYMKKFIKEYIHGMVGHMTMDNEDQFREPVAVVFFKVDYVLNPKGTNYVRNRVLKVAKEFKDRAMTFAIANIDEFRGKPSEFGVDASSLGSDPIVTIKTDDGSKFAMHEKFSVDTFKQFMADYFADKLTPFIKSEPVPESNDGPVKIVVGDTFNEIVNDPSKDVLIEFYAPWCGHCKSLEPKYTELGEKFKDVENIVIAKMDATANDVPVPFDVRGFPTIYWSSRKEKKKPTKYSGGREVSDFISFIKKEATEPFVLPVDAKENKTKMEKKSKKVLPADTKGSKKEKKSKKAKAPKDEL